MQTTPFPFETIAPKDYFYGREDEIESIKSHVENSTNVLLFSKRRMGKSTLIKNLFDTIKDQYKVIYIDIYNIITAEDFGNLLLKGITSQTKEDITETLKKYTTLFKRVRVEPTFDPNTGKMSIKPIINGLSFEELMEDSFNALFKLAQENKVVLAIDEFQQISTIKDVKIDAILRKYIQEPNNISYIFLGSKRNILNSLFAYKAPLYSMATPFSLKPLKKENIYTYSKQYLDIDENTISYLYDLSMGETKLIQMILHRVYISKDTIDILDNDVIDNMLSDILVSKHDHYKSIFEIFSTNHKKAFKLLCKYKKELFSENVLKVENISRSSMQSSLKQLFQKEYIDKEDGEYFVPDRCFELWGERNL